MRNILKIFDRKTKNIEADLLDSRGVGGAVARKTDIGNFGNYFAPILARTGLTKSYAEFTEELLNQMPADKVREMVSRANPIVAKAVNDFADNVAGGYTYMADTTVEDVIDSPQQRLLDDFVMLLETKQGGLTTIIQEWARDIFIHGGMFGELIIDGDGKTPLEIKTIDATTAIFRRQEDPIRGEYYELGQDLGWGTNSADRVGRSNFLYRALGGLGSLNFRSFKDEPTVQYRALQRQPNNPYGIPIIDPAVFSVIITASFMNAFSSSLKGHVYPNLLVTIDKEAFKKFAGQGANSEKVQEKYNQLITSLTESIKNLKPGAAIIQGSEVDIRGTLSGTARSPLGSVRDVQDVIRRDLIIGVQSQPVLMGSNESVTETHAREQIKSYTRLIRAAQALPNHVITGYFNYILRANGYAPLAEFQLNFSSSAEHRDLADTFAMFQDGLHKEAQTRQAQVESIVSAKEAQLIDDATAQRMWDEYIETSRQVNILAREL